jgi:type II secretory pathway pseudopilin PulG
MKKIYHRGQMLIQVLVFGFIAFLFISAIIGWFAISIKATRQTFNREQAIQIAEAGIDYYRWHLAHAPQDFKDGTGGLGPYTHNFSDKDGNIIGQFILNITPPPLGSTLVTIKSTGKVNADTHISRTITAKLGKPSIAKYAVAANDVMRFGEGTEVFGPIHSNQGIRFDGIAHNIISSAVSQYNDPDSDDCNNNVSFGVHTCVNPHDPSPPASVPNRTDIFQAGRQFPVPAIDFAGITADLAQMKSDAQANGFYRPSAGALGYHIVLKTDDTFDLYRVTSLTNAPSGCTNIQNQDGWGTWSIRNQHLIGNFSLPANGIIFLEDDIFVDGQINTARVTIVAAFFPDNPPFRKNIIVDNDLLYTNYDGQDAIGLIAQGNIHVGMISEDDLRIDGALIAQNGRVGRYYYRPPSGSQRCAPYHVRQTLTLYGMIATNQRYGFAYTDGNGYQTRNLIYDANLLYGPPPSFPLTSDQYVTISWQEIK